MKYIRLVQLFFVSTVVFIFIIGLINFMVDPFQQYRKAKFYKTIYTKEFYLNAGLIKNHDYDSVVIGSSMTENFIINEVNEYMEYGNSIKLTLEGGNLVEHSMVLNSAIKNGKVKNVLFGLDISSLNKSINRLPKHLYDYNIFNDYLYLLSIDTLKRSVFYPLISYTMPKNHIKLNYNLMYQWQQNYSDDDFSLEKVLDSMIKHPMHFDNSSNNLKSIKEKIENFEAYLYPLIRDNPNINYTIFYPPYSILLYKGMLQTNSLKDFIDMKEYIFNRLVEYRNVKIFDFQDIGEITYNFKNYKDISHYSQEISTWILKQMMKNKFLLTEYNIKVRYKNFRDCVESFDLNNSRTYNK